MYFIYIYNFKFNVLNVSEHERQVVQNIFQPYTLGIRKHCVF